MATGWFLIISKFWICHLLILKSKLDRISVYAHAHAIITEVAATTKPNYLFILGLLLCFFLTFGQQLFYGCGNISPGSALRPCLLRLSSLNLYINLYLRWRPGLKLLPVQKNPGMLPVGPAHQLCVSLGMCQEALATSPYSASLAKASGMAHLCLIFLINFKLECVKFNMGN